jgi:hypothetical protein
MNSADLPLNSWSSFYMIVGTAAAALTGLQFVAIALVGNLRRRITSREITAFASPTVVHFCSSLFLCAALSAPWRSFLGPGITLEACGLAGTIYALIVASRTHRQTRYRPVFEDWMWHVVLPLFAYITIFAAGVMLRRITAPCLFGVGAATLLLVFIGIHNAWDNIHYLAVNELKAAEPIADEIKKSETEEGRSARLEKT